MKPARLCLIVLAASLALFSCQGTGIQPPPKQPLAPPPEQVSIKPGINDDFLAKDVDLNKWVQTFESESREIAVQKDAIVASLQLKKGQDVADVGAGTGLFMRPLAEAVGVGGKVYELDISPTFVESLKKRAASEHLEQVEARLSKERSVELPPLSIDAAFVCDTYHHFEYPQHVLFSLYKAIRPLGKLYVVDFERVPGVSRPWVIDHVRANKKTFIQEIEQAGFVFDAELPNLGMKENYILRFKRQ